MLTDGEDAPPLHDVHTPVSSIWGYRGVGLRYPVLSDEDEKQTPAALEWEQCLRKNQRPRKRMSSSPLSFDRIYPPKCFKGDSLYTRRVVENGIAFRFGMKREILVGSGR